MSRKQKFRIYIVIAVILSIVGLGCISIDVWIRLRLSSSDLSKSLFFDLKITNIITAMFTIVLAIATMQLARSTEVLAENTRREWRERQTSNVIEVSRTIRDKVANLRRSITYDPHDLQEILNLLEYVAWSVRTGSLNGEMVKTAAKQDILHTYYLLRSDIERIRNKKNNPRLFVKLETLVNTWKEE